MNLKDVYQALDQEKVRAWASQQAYPLEESDGYLFLTVPIFIKGVKDEITCQLELEKIQQKGLAFNFYKVIHTPTNLGPVRLRALEETMQTFFDESLLLIDPINDWRVNHYIEKQETIGWQRRHRTLYTYNYNVPIYEVFELFEIIPDSQTEESESLPSNKWVYWNGMIFSRVSEYHQFHRMPKERSIIEDQFGQFQSGVFLTIEETQESFEWVMNFDYENDHLRIFTKDDRSFWDGFSTLYRYQENNQFSYQEFCALTQRSFKDPVQRFTDSEGNRLLFKVLDEKLFERTMKAYRPGDYVRFSDGDYGVIVQISDLVKGYYLIQEEKTSQREPVNYHLSEFEKIDAPDQSLVETLCFTANGRLGQIKKIGYEYSQLEILSLNAELRASFTHKIESLASKMSEKTLTNETLYIVTDAHLKEWAKTFETLTLKTWYEAYFKLPEYEMLHQFLSYYQLLPWEESIQRMRIEDTFHFLLTFLLQRPTFKQTLYQMLFQMVMEIGKDGRAITSNETRHERIQAFNIKLVQFFHEQSLIQPLTNVLTESKKELD